VEPQNWGLHKVFLICFVICKPSMWRAVFLTYCDPLCLQPLYVAFLNTSAAPNGWVCFFFSRRNNYCCSHFLWPPVCFQLIVPICSTIFYRLSMSRLVRFCYCPHHLGHASFPFIFLFSRRAVDAAAHARLTRQTNPCTVLNYRHLLGESVDQGR
jgi:hypothetical protein